MIRRALVLAAALLCASCIQPTPQQVDAANKFSGNMAALGAGLAGKVSYLGGALMPDGDKSFHVHGKWCGKGFPSDADINTKVRVVSDGRDRALLVKADLFPEDEVDLACARHDVCYLATPDDGVQKMATPRGDCDVILMCRMYEILQSGRQDLLPQATKVLAWAGGAMWRRLNSDCRRMGVHRIRDWQFIPDQS